MGAKTWKPTLLLDVFGDTLCRDILVATIDSPSSAASLAERFDVSPPTVYNRLNQLLEFDLVREHRRVDEDGTHYRAFESSLRRAVIEVDNDGYAVNIEHRRDLDDRFEGFWAELVGSSQLGRRGRESSVSRSKRNDEPSSL